MRNELPVIKRRLFKLSTADMAAVAEKAGVGTTHVWRIAHGRTVNPGYLTMHRIVKAMRALGV